MALLLFFLIGGHHVNAMASYYVPKLLLSSHRPHGTTSRRWGTGVVYVYRDRGEI